MNKERITHVAIEADDGTLFFLSPPHRHSDVLLEMQRAKYSAHKSTQGFLTSHDRFVDRKEALDIARGAHQLIKPTELKQLYSEDIW